MMIRVFTLLGDDCSSKILFRKLRCALFGQHEQRRSNQQEEKEEVERKGESEALLFSLDSCRSRYDAWDSTVFPSAPSAAN